MRGLGALRGRTQPLGAPQILKRITAHNNALALGPRPGAFIAPPSMRGGKIVHPLAHRPIITQRFRPARRAGAAIRGPGQPRNAPAQDAEKTPDQPDSSQPRAGAPGLEVSLRELTQRCLLQLHDNLLRRVLRELPHGHPFCPATSSQDYSEQPSQNKRSEKPRPLHKTQTPPRRIVEVVFNAQDAVAADVGVSLQLPGWWLHGLRESGAAR